MTPETERAALIERTRKLRDECRQIFADASSWNENHPNETPIDPDPDGKLNRILAGLDHTLRNEGTVAS